jgi:molybdopterin molybdotransferase
VSVGDADHVRPLLEAHGRIDFWRLAIKPGKPFAFGHFRGLPMFGLPGNPVSSLVTFLVMVRPALQLLAGMAPTPLPHRSATLCAPLRKAPGRRDFQRGIRVESEDASLQVMAFERQDSNVLSGVAAADCLIDLPTEVGDLPAGSKVRVIPLAGLLG